MNRKNIKRRISVFVTRRGCILTLKRAQLAGNKSLAEKPITALPVDEQQRPVDFIEHLRLSPFLKPTRQAKMCRKLDEARAKYPLLAEAARDRLARSFWFVEVYWRKCPSLAGLQPYKPFLR